MEHAVLRPGSMPDKEHAMAMFRQSCSLLGPRHWATRKCVQSAAKCELSQAPIVDMMFVAGCVELLLDRLIGLSEVPALQGHIHSAYPAEILYPLLSRTAGGLIKSGSAEAFKRAKPLLERALEWEEVSEGMHASSVHAIQQAIQACDARDPGMVPPHSLVDP